MRAIDRWTERIEGARWLEPVAEQVGRLAARLIPAGVVKDVLSGRQLGHPAHPALVLLPWTALGAVTLLDLLEGRPRDSPTRERLLVWGLGLALPAAASGAAELSDTTGAERRVGAVHALVNGMALGLYGGSLLARRSNRHGAGVALGVAGAGVLAAGSFLGGHLTYGLGVGVDTTAFSAGPTEWERACRSTELEPGTLHAVEVAGVGVVLARTPHGLFALANRCTHRGGPLAEGELHGNCVACPWHDSRFRLDDGTPIAGPATRPQPVYETRERNGWVEIRRAEPRSLRANPAV